MQRIVKIPFLASLYVCDRRRILRNISIISRNLSREEATQKALVKMESFRKTAGHYTALHKLHGLYDGDVGNTCCSPGTATHLRRVSSHEEFHRKVDVTGLDKKSRYPPLEESAAYAYETMAELRGKAMARAIRRYGTLARHSLRFLFALDRGGHEEVLVESVAQLCKERPKALAGDDIAIAINSAVDCMFYLECMAVLQRWGLGKGEKILLEAVGVSDEKGADAGRRFLMERLTRKTRDKINASYGINLDGFRFRSLYSPNVKDDTWEW
jgi:hypothetical protein